MPDYLADVPIDWGDPAVQEAARQIKDQESEKEWKALGEKFRLDKPDEKPKTKPRARKK